MGRRRKNANPRATEKPMARKRTKPPRRYPLALQAEVWRMLEELKEMHPELNLAQIIDQALELFRLHVKVLGYPGVLKQLESRVALGLHAKSEKLNQSKTSD